MKEMFAFIKSDTAEIFSRIDMMDKKSIRTRFIIAVVLGVIGGIAFTLWNLSGGQLTLGQLIMIIVCWLVGDLVGIFAYLLEWRLLFRWIVAPFKGGVKYLWLVLVLIMISVLVYCFIPLIVGFKGIISMNSRS